MSKRANVVERRESTNHRSNAPLLKKLGGRLHKRAPAERKKERTRRGGEGRGEVVLDKLLPSWKIERERERKKRFVSGSSLLMLSVT